MDKEQIDLLKQASEEIRSLRNRNQYQSGRLQMFDDMMLMLRTTPGYGSSPGQGEDIAWKIYHAVAQAEAENK